MENGNYKRRLIIHIGTHKTGTTAIEKFLSLNRLALEKYGIYIPKTGLSGKYDGHHNIAWELHGETPLFNTKFGTLNDLEKELAGISYKTVVISSDYFECFYDSNDRLKKLKDFTDRLGMETHIVVCFRQETEYIPMIYEELLKGGLSMDFNDFVAEIIENGKIYFKRYGGWDFCFDYNKIVSGFSNFFGKEFVKVFDYIPPAEIQFLKLLKIENTEDFIFPGKVNQPLPSFILKTLKPYNIIAERFETFNFFRKLGAPAIRYIIKLFVAFGLFSNVSSTVMLNSSQKESIVKRFSYFTLK